MEKEGMSKGMKRITIYKIEPTFFIGDINNLFKLKNKIEKDNIKMDEIKNIFELDEEKYKKGFLKAKINYIKNMVTYNWLLLEKYFGDALYSDIFKRDNYTNKELIDNGWLLPHFFINKSFSFRNDVSIEENYITILDSNFDFFFDFNIGNKNSRVDMYYH